MYHNLKNDHAISIIRPLPSNFNASVRVSRYMYYIITTLCVRCRSKNGQTTWPETYFRQYLFPAYLFFRYQFHAIVIFRLKFFIYTLDPSPDFLVNSFTQN